MSTTITSDEAIKLLGLATKPRVIKEIELSVAPDVTDKFLEAIDMAIEALGKLESHWIPVTEESIPDGEYLITWTSDIQEKPIISIVCRYSGVWDCWELQALGHRNINILAYMPKPEPFKGVTE